MSSLRFVSCLVTVGFILLGGPAAEAQNAKPTPPPVGAESPGLELADLKGNTVSLKKLIASGPVVLLVLRGWPGYQCPICSRQVGEFLGKADQLKDAGAQVVMVYPGPADLLKEHAAEFQRAREFPAH